MHSSIALYQIYWLKTYQKRRFRNPNLQTLQQFSSEFTARREKNRILRYQQPISGQIANGVKNCKHGDVMINLHEVTRFFWIHSRDWLMLIMVE